MNKNNNKEFVRMMEIIRMVRLSKKISQAKLARDINSSQKQVSCYERGEQIPSVTTLFNMCERLDIGFELTNSNKQDSLFRLNEFKNDLLVKDYLTR